MCKKSALIWLNMVLIIFLKVQKLNAHICDAEWMKFERAFLRIIVFKNWKFLFDWARFWSYNFKRWTVQKLKAHINFAVLNEWTHAHLTESFSPKLLSNCKSFFDWKGFFIIFLKDSIEIWKCKSWKSACWF